MTDKLHAQFWKRDSFRIAGFARSSRSVKRARPNDEGSMLVEVLVALLVLALVFTSAVLALSNMASQRVAVEQRDRAVRLIIEYEELSRIFRCGFIVDRENKAGSEGIWNGKIERCAFGDINDGNPPRNAGDQSFTIDEDTGDGQQEFNLTIRYWWEVPGDDIHLDTCNDIRAEANSGGDPDGLLPSILVRAFEITWDEKGSLKRETLIKKDPLPVDTAIFASGSRYSVLSGNPTSRLSLINGSDSRGIVRVLDSSSRFPGQPRLCSWFPYLTNRDTSERALLNGSTVNEQTLPGGAVQP